MIQASQPDPFTPFLPEIIGRFSTGERA